MRRLPIFFLLDISESMIGEDLRSLETGVGEIVNSLRSDAHELETVHLSVLAFAGKARTIMPLMDLVSFGCGKLHCIDGDGEATCPWCSKVGRYAIAGEDDPGHDVERGRG